MTEEFVNLSARCGTAVGALMLFVWLLSLIKNDASIVDIAWGLGFVLVAWTAYCGGGKPYEARSLLIPTLTSVWGVRLSAYLFWRNHGRPEDYRYRAMREKWGNSFAFVSLLTVFGLQGAIMWLVSLPVQIGSAQTERNIVWLTTIGIASWGIGIFFESVGDLQLAWFKSNPDNTGRVLDTGLWRYTRHPNYFGDFLVWWGLYVIVLSRTGAWWTIISPIVMSIFLMRVSGVTLLEKALTNTKPDYASYVERTNAFFPGFNRR